ncbi:MAG: ribosomal protein S18-alanine N-acetyltransferase [Acidobacteria bacterium]|nr:ribosomal protein S18-alanine N-acetyltransferase [Acidobacteriota bacterium]MCW5967067.1 ribosomal protein S18-alanine N-acetyltransferase [Blastocatellales bacterium]
MGNNASSEIVRIESLTEDRIEEVRELERSCGLRSFDASWYESELRRESSVFIIAIELGDESGGEPVVGAITGWVVAGDWEVDNLAVSKAHRRKGIGLALMKAAAGRAALLGVQRAVLEVRYGNVAAQTLYHRLGFREAGRRRNYYSDPVEDALLLMCEGEEWGRLLAGLGD